jgi:outer membrane protein TolC
MNRIRFLILVLCPLALTACQEYRPSPLDLAAYDADLAARNPFAPDVLAYAKQLAGPSTQPSAFEPSDGLSLREAEVVALFFNPDVRIARLKANVPHVGAAEAGRWEDPELGIDGERIIDGVDDPWVLGGMLHLTIPISGRLGIERDKALSEASAGELRALAEERRVLAELRAAWAEWSAASERAALTRQLVAELDPVVERAERLRAAGELDPVDARLLRIERVSQAGKLQGYEADARAAELELKARLGLLSTADVKLLPAIPASSVSMPVEDTPAVVAEHPRVRLARAEYEVAERTLKLEVRKQYPDIRLGGGFGTDEGEDRVLFGAALPLPVFNANRRAIVEARANREVARAAAEAEYERLLADASVARARLDAAREQLAYVEKELAPLADQQVADARRLGQLGDFNTLVLLEALTTAHEARLEVLDARLKLALGSRRLEALLEGGSPATGQKETK